MGQNPKLLRHRAAITDHVYMTWADNKLPAKNPSSGEEELIKRLLMRPKMCECGEVFCGRYLSVM
jgi:hypothetical protein